MKFRIGFGFSLMALLVLVSIANIALPVHAQTPDVAVTQVYWGSDGDNKLQPKPGDKAVPLTVETRILSEEGLSSMLATLRLDGSPFSSIVDEKEAFAGVVGPISLGGSASLVFWLDIAEEAIPAEYKVFLNLDIKTPRFTSAVGISKEIPLPFYGKVDLSLQLAPKIVKPGSNVVELVVENLGQAKAKSVETTLSAPSTLTFLETDGRLVLGEIKPGEKTSTSFRVYAPNSAVGSPVLIAAAIEYFDPYGVQRTESRVLGLAVGNGTVALGGLEVLRLAWGDPIVDSGVSPGESNARLHITIRNVSNNTITGVKGQLLLEDPFLSLSGGEFVVAEVAEIKPSRTGVLSYTFDVSAQANPGTYTLPFSLDYLI
ncbi:MAG: COG1361 S-layer family protein, partial [Candidatus Bathyarchaeia archaeon]